MTRFKRKKNVKQRGLKTHGWGAKKKHRGAGNRGGRGMAGTGKRADQKKPTILKLYGNEYFGKKGFTIPDKVKKYENTINLYKLDSLVEGSPKTNNEPIMINLSKLGYTKLLGTGKITKRMKIIIDSYSKKAENKIKQAGGEIISNKSESER